MSNTKPDAHVDGFITDSQTSISFKTNVSCNGAPNGSISGNVSNVFTGGPSLSNFSFSSNNPILLGTLVSPNFVQIVFGNVTVKNKTTSQTFTGGNAVVTAERLTSNLWRGSITIFFNGHILTFFGNFTGNVTVNKQVLCQVLL